MRRQAAIIFGLLLGLTAAPASAQFVSRDEVTLSGLTRASDIVTLGEVKEVRTLGEGQHEAVLVRVSPQQVLKGPEQPGEAFIFLYRAMMPSLAFEVGENPLLFLGQLEKEDLRCTDCGKTWDQVHDLPEGNYYRVVGANWGNRRDVAAVDHPVSERRHPFSKTGDTQRRWSHVHPAASGAEVQRHTDDVDRLHRFGPNVSATAAAVARPLAMQSGMPTPRNPAPVMWTPGSAVSRSSMAASRSRWPISC